MTSTICVFCGKPIGGGEPMAGRPPAAAHAACADAALTDDRHWDAVAAASGQPMDDPSGQPMDEPAAGEEAASTGRRAGCLALVVVAAVVVALFSRARRPAGPGP